MKAFVTGSTGLLGSNLVNALIAAGYEVKALARTREKADKLFHQSQVEIVAGDIENIPAFAPHMADCDVLFHSAGYVREAFEPGNHWPKLNKINVQGTLELLTQAESYGVKKAVHTSSTAVVGIEVKGKPSDENTPPDDYSRNDPYARSKLLTDRAIDDFLKAHHLPVMRILPAGLIGPQDMGPSVPGQAIIQLLEGKLPIVPPGGASLVDARDVATAMIRAAERGRSGERYIVSKDYMTLEQLVITFGMVSGMSIPTRHVPYTLLRLLAHVGEAASRITGTPSMLSVNALKAMNRKHELSAEKAIRELGLTFRPFEDTMRDTINWFLANGYVRSVVHMQSMSA